VRQLFSFSHNHYRAGCIAAHSPSIVCVLPRTISIVFTTAILGPLAYTWSTRTYCIVCTYVVSVWVGCVCREWNPFIHPCLLFRAAVSAQYDLKGSTLARRVGLPPHPHTALKVITHCYICIIVVIMLTVFRISICLLLCI
jgi:hypothetical protein